MDKYEYKVRADEIKRLIGERDYVQAADIADTIDWRRVKSVMMLCMVSDLYKINRRYEDAKNMLLLAYERRPGGRTICYSLCELCIKTEDILRAVNYYKEFVQAAPKDPGRYILQYKIYEAQEVSLEERISVLEELKKRDYREKWAYELAYLYHRVGLGTRCVEECDELILWFGSGKYVIKAMELKMLHEPLTSAQQEVYDHRFDNVRQDQEEGGYAPESVENDGAGYLSGEDDAGEYDSAERPSGEYDGEYGAGEYDPGAGEGYLQDREEQYGGEEYGQHVREESFPGTRGIDNDSGAYSAGEHGSGSEGGFLRDAEERREQETMHDGSEELDIRVKTMDVGKFNTINLQEELAAGLQEVLGAEEGIEGVREEKAETQESRKERPGISEHQDDRSNEDDEDEVEVFFGETGEIRNMPKDILREAAFPGGGMTSKEEGKEDAGKVDVKEAIAAEGIGMTGTSAAERVGKAEAFAADRTGELVLRQMRDEAVSAAKTEAVQAQPPKELAGVLSQEADGQIRLVVPENTAVEKQITGQMKIEDILAEWERMKQESKERRREEVRQHVLQQTGPMFTEFEAAVRDGLLEQLEADENAEPGVPDSGDYAEDWDSEEAEGRYLQGAQIEDEFIDEQEEQPDFGEAEGYFAPFADDEAIEEDFSDMDEENLYTDEIADRDEFAGDESLREAEPAGAEEDFEETAEPAGLEEDFEETAEPAGLEEDFEETAEPAGLEEDFEEAAEPAGLEEDFEETAEPAGLEEDFEEAAEPAGLEEDFEEAAEPAGLEEDFEETAEPAGSEEGFEGSGEDAGGQEENEKPPVERDLAKVRALTREEKELYAPFIQSRRSREQLVKAIDNISMAAYTGNIVVTGEEGMNTMTLVQNMIREVQLTDSNFSGKVAKISGKGLNDRDVRKTLEELNGGALIIYGTSDMSRETAKSLYRSLQQERLGIIVALEGTRKSIHKLFQESPELTGVFTARMDVEALSNDTLVLFGKRYAREMEYSIDDLGVLALHTRIEEMQTIDHVVTVIDVKKIVDEAIRRAGRKTLKHFFDILFAKRYDDEDMIVLTEKDFVA